MKEQHTVYSQICCPQRTIFSIFSHCALYFLLDGGHSERNKQKKNKKYVTTKSC